MPRIRTVKPEFWSHPIMCRQDDATRLLALALLNYSDDHGFFLADPAAVRSFARPFDDDSTNVRASLENLSKIEYIRIVDHPQMGPIGWVIKFSSHQRVDRPNPSKLKDYFDSGITRRLIDERSTEEGKGKEQGKERKEPSAHKPRGPKPNSQMAKASGETRHSRLQGMIMTWYQEWAGVQCPWNGAEGKQLQALIKSTPDWPDQNFVTCLINLGKSPEYVPQGSSPHEWLSKIPKFLKGPLDRYGRPAENHKAVAPAVVSSKAADDELKRQGLIR